MEKETYSIFEFNGTAQKLFFSPVEFVNQGIDINRLTLFHLHCIDNDYFLFFGKNGSDNRVEFLFQFNKGDEFVEFLINSGATYHRFDVAAILAADFYTKFKLKDGQRIQIETYATGITTGLNIYALNEKNNKIVEDHGSHKILLALPYATLKLDQTGVTLNLKWSEKTENNEAPATFTNTFNEVVDKQKIAERKRFYYRSVAFGLIALIIFYFYFIL